MKVEVKHLYKDIKGAQILDDINLTMHSGCIYGLQGKNGSGKTMLMRCLCGLILPTRGEVLIDGECIGKDIDFPRSVGVLIENPSFLNDYTGLQNLKMLASIKGEVGAFSNPFASSKSSAAASFSVSSVMETMVLIASCFLSSSISSLLIIS